MVHWYPVPAARSYAYQVNTNPTIIKYKMRITLIIASVLKKVKVWSSRVLAAIIHKDTIRNKYI